MGGENDGCDVLGERAGWNSPKKTLQNERKSFKIRQQDGGVQSVFFRISKQFRVSAFFKRDKVRLFYVFAAGEHKSFAKRQTVSTGQKFCLKRSEGKKLHVTLAMLGDRTSPLFLALLALRAALCIIYPKMNRKSADVNTHFFLNEMKQRGVWMTTSSSACCFMWTSWVYLMSKIVGSVYHTKWCITPDAKRTTVRDSPPNCNFLPPWWCTNAKFVRASCKHIRWHPSCVRHCVAWQQFAICR